MNAPVDITRYDPVSGALGLHKRLSDSLLDTEPPHVMGWHDGNQFYVVDGELVAKLPNPAVLIGMELHDVPLPSTITIEGERYEVYDHIVILNFPLAGTYSVMLLSHPYQNKVFEVTQP